ncbi:MAG: phosphopyruvate hydratase [Deltaproteobacteria bacterium]|nr:phosphopyruvate hydratase [Deltaproteobacteria bacterium]
MTEIVEVRAREILDSRGTPTIEVDVILAGGAVGRAAVPSGASTGLREALEMRDGDKSRFRGKGVRNAIRNIVEELAPDVIGLDALDHGAVDGVMLNRDGTKNKQHMGANAILAVSMATARAAANAVGLPLYRYLGGAGARMLPVPMMNFVNGGKHADNNIDIQEFMVVPWGFDRFSEALRASVEIYWTLKDQLKTAGLSTNVGDEGGVAPNLESTEQVLEHLVRAIEKAGYEPMEQVALALDPAASEFYDYKFATYSIEGKQLNSQEMVAFWNELSKKFPIVSIEDGLDENDWEGFALMTKSMGDRLQIVGDDIYVTNPEFIARGIREHTSNSVLIKLNQVGSLTETLKAIDMTHKAGFSAVISHRSGETEDTFIADLAVAMNTGLIKTGSAARTDRIAKYNQLMRIEEELGDSAEYPGKAAFRGVVA